MITKIFSKKTVYYASTIFIAIMVGIVGGIVDIIQTSGVINISKVLGYPLYFFTLLGVFKILGGIVLLLPTKFKDLRLVAYTGFTFDFIFASYSHFSIGDELLKILIPLLFLTFLAISYSLKNKF